MNKRGALHPFLFLSRCRFFSDVLLSRMTLILLLLNCLIPVKVKITRDEELNSV